MDLTTIIITLLVIGMIAGGAFWYLRSQPGKEEPSYYFKCPGCKQKLKYRARQAGHEGMCPRCSQRLTFPKVVPAEHGKASR